MPSLVGSEMCIRDRCRLFHRYQKKISELDRGARADRRAAPHWHVHTRRALAPTGRRQAHKQGCIVQCAEPRETRACIQDASCADASGAQGAAPRSWRPRLQEQKVWSARGEAGAAARRGRRRAHGMASRLRPGRGRTPGWDVGWGDGRGELGFASSVHVVYHGVAVRHRRWRDFLDISC